jgi:hypothetical protein
MLIYVYVYKVTEIITVKSTNVRKHVYILVNVEVGK